MHRDVIMLEPRAVLLKTLADDSEQRVLNLWKIKVEKSYILAATHQKCS